MSEDSREYVLSKTPGGRALPPPKPLRPIPTAASPSTAAEPRAATPQVQFPPRGVFAAMHGIGASAIAPANAPSSAAVAAQLKQRTAAAAALDVATSTEHDFEVALAAALMDEEDEDDEEDEEEDGDEEGRDDDALATRDRRLRDGVHDRVRQLARAALADAGISDDAEPAVEVEPVARPRGPVGAFETQLQRVHDAVHTAAGLTPAPAFTSAPARPSTEPVRGHPAPGASPSHAIVVDLPASVVPALLSTYAAHPATARSRAVRSRRLTMPLAKKYCSVLGRPPTADAESWPAADDFAGWYRRITEAFRTALPSVDEHMLELHAATGDRVALETIERTLLTLRKTASVAAAAAIELLLRYARGTLSILLRTLCLGSRTDPSVLRNAVPA